MERRSRRRAAGGWGWGSGGPEPWPREWRPTGAQSCHRTPSPLPPAAACTCWPAPLSPVPETCGQPRPSPSALFHSLIPERAQKHPHGVPFQPLQTCCHSHACSTSPTVQTHLISDCWHLELKLTFPSNRNLPHSLCLIIFPASQAESL